MQSIVQNYSYTVTHKLSLWVERMQIMRDRQMDTRQQSGGEGGGYNAEIKMRLSVRLISDYVSCFCLFLVFGATPKWMI